WRPRRTTALPGSAGRGGGPRAGTPTRPPPPPGGRPRCPPPPPRGPGPPPARQAAAPGARPPRAGAGAPLAGDLEPQRVRRARRRRIEAEPLNDVRTVHPGRLDRDQDLLLSRRWPRDRRRLQGAGRTL